MLYNTIHLNNAEIVYHTFPFSFYEQKRKLYVYVTNFASYKQESMFLDINVSYL
jgi:hypothetical protein